jgi:biotin carboxyl carrier protein
MNPGIRINGECADPPAGADIIETEPGVFSVLADGVSYEAHVLGNGITIAGHCFTFEIDDPREWKRSKGESGAHGSAAILAPMPGKVVRVLVRLGDELTAGQGVVVVEAMKMQNELKTPRAGRVSAVNVKEQDSVNAGAVLAVIE